MSLMSRLKANTKIKEASVLSDSEVFKQADFTTLDVPMLNVALSGKLSGGLSAGVTILAGQSKHFKSSFALKMASGYLKKHPDAILLFYDSEFGAPQAYFQIFGIDLDRVWHVPVKDMEEFKLDVVKQLDSLEKSDKVIIVIDSIGNLASKKELADVLDGNSKTDMTRAKELKGVFRMITPYLTLKNIPFIGVAHTYKEQGLFPKDIVSGGTGLYYSANTVWLIGRRQAKEGTELIGHEFVIRVDKSRFVKEKSEIPISVSFDNGIDKFSGLLEIALDGGFVSKPSNGWYQKVDTNTGELIGAKLREKDTNTEEFWQDILENEKFIRYVENRYLLDHEIQESMPDEA